MLAARLWAREDVRVEEIPDVGEPPAGWVRLRVEACGICGTDVEEFRAGPLVVPTFPHPLTGRCAPLTLGHEAVGVVDARGTGVPLDLGARVAVEGNLFCGTCWWCERRQFQLCIRNANVGLMTDGGLAEQMLAPSYMCLPLESGVDPVEAVLAEPLAVAIRAARRAGVRLGTSVCIVGSGTVGLLLVQAVRLMGARAVIAVDHQPARRNLAIRFGADVAVAPDAAAAACDELTGGVSVDVAIEAAGNSKAAALAVRLARRGGRAIVLGVFAEPIALDMPDFLLGEKEVAASMSHVFDTDFADAVRLINADHIDTTPMVTDRIALEDVVTQGFQPLIADPAAHLKIAVVAEAPRS